MSKAYVDYLIVGGGIGGIVLALQLHEAGHSIVLYDKEIVSSASRVAAGIINPVTGQRFVKSWMYDTLIEAAGEFYERYDNRWGEHYFKWTKIQRALFSKNEVSNFEFREGDEHYGKHFASDAASIQKRHFKTAEDWCTVLGARLDIFSFISSAKKYLSTAGVKIIDEQFDYAALDILKDYIAYKNTKYKKMVCSEGIGIVENPHFKYLPMVPAKGECLIVEIPSIETKDIYKHKIFFVPINARNQFWVGANYDWEYSSSAPTEEGREWLMKKIMDSIQVPFNVKRHIAAVRPTGKDRRPYLGSHPAHKHVYVFNALGTKGSSLAPYWAARLIAYMEDGQALDKEVNIDRFTLT